jgi:hypothetical protein
MIKARAVAAACALAIVGAGSTACGAIGLSALAQHKMPAAPSLSTSCQPGHASQDRSRNGTFTPGSSTDANAFEVTFTNAGHSRTATVEELGVGFYDASGANIGSDTPVGSKTVASGNIPVPPAISLSVIFYRPNSGISHIRSSPPGTWVVDDHMPSNTTRCEVLSVSFGWP